MAQLSSAELVAIRRSCSELPGAVMILTKAQSNALSQAIEDWLTSKSAEMSALIDATTTPRVMTAANKKKWFAEVVYAKYLRDK